LQAMLRQRAADLTAEAEVQTETSVVEQLELTIKKLRQVRFADREETAA
jgi:hypothetical protein